MKTSPQLTLLINPLPPTTAGQHSSPSTLRLVSSREFSCSDWTAPYESLGLGCMMATLLMDLMWSSLMQLYWPADQ